MHERATQVTRRLDSKFILEKITNYISAHVPSRFAICGIARHGSQENVYIFHAGGTSCVRRNKMYRRLATINVDYSLTVETISCHFSPCVVKSIACMN